MRGFAVTGGASRQPSGDEAATATALVPSTERRPTTIAHRWQLVPSPPAGEVVGIEAVRRRRVIDWPPRHRVIPTATALPLASTTPPALSTILTSAKAMSCSHPCLSASPSCLAHLNTVGRRRCARSWCLGSASSGARSIEARPRSAASHPRSAAPSLNGGRRSGAPASHGRDERKGGVDRHARHPQEQGVRRRRCHPP